MRESTCADDDIMLGEECTFREYLKSLGLYASKSPIYLMTTLTGDIESSTREDSIRSLIIVASSSFGEEKLSEIKKVFMGCSRSELTGEFQSLHTVSMPIQNMSCDQCRAAKPQAPLFGVALKDDEGTLCTVENADAHCCMISYEMYTESSYSEVILTSLCFPEKIALTSNVSLSLICKTSTKKNSILWSMASEWFTFQRADVHEPPSKLPSSPSPGKVSP